MENILGLTNKGQIGLGSLLGIIIVIIVFSSLTPVLNYFVNYATGELGPGNVANIVINIWPLMLVIAILWAMFTYGQPRYEYRG